MRYVSTRGEAPALGFIDVTLAGSCPRRRPLCAGILAAFSRRDRSPRLPAGPMRRSRARSSGRSSATRSRTPTSRAWRARPTAPSAIRRSRRWSQLVARHLPARAVSRADARLQGRGDAVPVAADGSRADPARRARHHRGRDLGRHRRRRGRGVSRPQSGRSDRALSARPHLRRAAAHDDDAARAERACARDRRHVRRLPGDREGHVQPPRLPRPRAALRASTRSTGRASSRRWSITSPPRSRSARRIARSPSRCRPAISATSSPAMWRRAWACRSIGW